MFLKTVIACVFLLHTSRCCHFRVGAFSPSIAHRSSRGTATRRPQPAFISVTLKESSNNEPENPKELTPDSIAEMAEVSFVNACLQLAQGYVDVLKLFIVAVKAGYELNISPASLITLIDQVPHQSAGRDLMAEEVKLRNKWIQVIYLVLDTLKHEKKVAVDGTDDEADAIDTVIQETFTSNLIADMQARHDAGDAFQLDHWLDTYSFPDMQDPVEKAIISQSFRVLWVVFTVLEEEKVCLEEKSGLKAQPPIPGAFDE